MSSVASTLTLGAVRGTVLILQNAGSTGLFQAVLYSSLQIADDYHIATIWDFGEKQDRAKHNIQLSHGRDTNLHLTYLSGSGGVMPYYAAREMNDYFYKRILRNPHDRWINGNIGKGLGIVAMDFPGSDIISLIKAYNPHITPENYCFWNEWSHRADCKQGCPQGWGHVGTDSHGCCRSFFDCFGNRKLCADRVCVADRPTGARGCPASHPHRSSRSH